MTLDSSQTRPRILVVEDYWLVAMEATRMLEEEGCEVVGPFGAVRDAEPSARAAALEGAILDVDLGGETSLALADILLGRQIPFAVASGTDTAHLPEGFEGGTYLGKPYTPAMVRKFLASIGVSGLPSRD